MSPNVGELDLQQTIYLFRQPNNKTERDGHSTSQGITASTEWLSFLCLCPNSSSSSHAVRDYTIFTYAAAAPQKDYRTGSVTLLHDNIELDSLLFQAPRVLFELPSASVIKRHTDPRHWVLSKGEPNNQRIACTASGWKENPLKSKSQRWINKIVAAVFSPIPNRNFIKILFSCQKLRKIDAHSSCQYAKHSKQQWVQELIQFSIRGGCHHRFTAQRTHRLRLCAFRVRSFKLLLSSSHQPGGRIPLPLFWRLSFPANEPLSISDKLARGLHI